MQTLEKIRESRRAPFLEAASKASEFSQASVAAAMGVSVPTYRKLAENPQMMTVAQLDAVCDYLDCKREDIFLPSDRN